jgi:NAD(P)-dependent dehydrogenase (short-subunit alcohol dehydrogenase family)
MATLEGAVVVVTGAGRGIGRAIAEVLGQGGAKVVVNYSQSKGPAEDLVARLQQSGSPESVANQADVSDPAQAVRLIEETVKHFGRIDLLVTNAGIIGFTRSAALELARSNVTANVVAPGYTRSEMSNRSRRNRRRGCWPRFPSGACANPRKWLAQSATSLSMGITSPGRRSTSVGGFTCRKRPGVAKVV